MWTRTLAEKVPPPEIMSPADEGEMNGDTKTVGGMTEIEVGRLRIGSRRNQGRMATIMRGGEEATIMMTTGEMIVEVAAMDITIEVKAKTTGLAEIQAKLSRVQIISYLKMCNKISLIIQFDFNSLKAVVRPSSLFCVYSDGSFINRDAFLDLLLHAMFLFPLCHFG